MLAGQATINFATNAFSAAFGLLNVFIFTRFFGPAEFGIYVLGVGFAYIISAFLSSWLQLFIAREQARGDGTDVRGIVLPGFFLSCLLAPAAYVAARLAGLDNDTALAAIGLSLSIGFFETSQALLRARLQAFTVMKATMVRAILVPALGISFTTVSNSGVLLLVSSALAYLIAALAFTREIWSGTVIRYDGARLLRLATAGLPLTLSITMLSMSNVVDRFVIAHMIGSGYAGQYTAGVDLVRQVLIIPAVSVAAAYFPLAVQIYANRGQEAVRSHLDESIEFLLAIVLPACLGFAIVSPHLSNVILGHEFRGMANEVMPVVSIAVIFQIIAYQYFHISFLLSGRNVYYLLHTGSVFAFNVALSFMLIARFGAIGAAWAKLSAEVFGCFWAFLLTRWAFPVPLPLRRLTLVLTAAVVMAVIVKGLDLMLVVSDKGSLIILMLAGVASYSVMCWLLDIANTRQRLDHCLLIVRKALVH